MIYNLLGILSQTLQRHVLYISDTYNILLKYTIICDLEIMAIVLPAGLQYLGAGKEVVVIQSDTFKTESVHVIHYIIISTQICIQKCNTYSFFYLFAFLICVCLILSSILIQKSAQQLQSKSIQFHQNSLHDCIFDMNMSLFCFFEARVRL